MQETNAYTIHQIVHFQFVYGFRTTKEKRTNLNRLDRDQTFHMRFAFIDP